MFDIDKVYGFFYNADHKNKKINESNLDTKKNRDNRKLDLMRAVMESTKATKSFLSPGNFDTLKANNDIINKAKMKAGKREFTIDGDEFVEAVNIMSPSTQVTVADQNLTGKALIGVSANANAAHALFQLATTLQLEMSFKFDGESYTALNNQYVVGKDKLITKVISETLAAFVDNGKDPQAKYSNINNYTIDIAMSMALLGIDLDTIQFFLSQNVIEDYVTTYFNNGANKKAEDLAKQQIAERYGKTKKIFNISKKNLADPNFVSNFDTNNLRETVAKDLSPDESIEMLKTFLAYKSMSRPISNLVTAIKVGEQGLGPSDSDNLFRLDQLSESNFKGIKGASELLERTDLFTYHLNQVIENGRKLIVGNRDKGQIHLPNRDLGAFYLLRQMFDNYKSDTRLNVKEIEFINKNYLDYLASNQEFYKFDKPLIARLPSNLSIAKELNSDYTDKYSPLLNRLSLDVDKNNNITYIVYTGISGQDKNVVDLIRDTWESMLYDETEIKEGYKYSDLAKDLVKYSYMIAGFRISPQSFSHLQPVAFYTDILPDFNKVMEQQIIAAENVSVDAAGGTGAYAEYVEHFYHQFIRNHFRNLSYIPTADIENSTNIRSFKFNEKNKNLEFVLVGEENQDFLDKDGEFVEYAKVVVDKQLMLLKRGGVNKDSVIYTPTESYGTHKSKAKGGLTSGKMFTQYEFGSVPTTSFKQNKVKKTKVTSNFANTDNTTEKLDSLWEKYKDNILSSNPDMSYEEFIKTAIKATDPAQGNYTMESFEEYLKKCKK